MTDISAIGPKELNTLLNAGMVGAWSTVKGTLNPPVLTRKVNIPAFMCFSVFVFVGSFVSVFELTRVDAYIVITCTCTCK